MKKNLLCIVAMVVCVGQCFAMEQEKSQISTKNREARKANLKTKIQNAKIKIVEMTIQQNEPEFSMSGYQGPVNQVIFLKGSTIKRCLTCSSDGYICLWDLEKRKTIRVFNCLFPVKCIGLTKIDMETFVVAYVVPNNQKRLIIWNLKNGSLSGDQVWGCKEAIMFINGGKSEGDVNFYVQNNVPVKHKGLFNIFEKENICPSTYSMYYYNVLNKNIPIKTTISGLDVELEKMCVSDIETKNDFWLARSVDGSLGIYGGEGTHLYDVSSCEVEASEKSNAFIIKCACNGKQYKIKITFVVSQVCLEKVFGHHYMVNYNTGEYVRLN